ncbi:aldose 1-epimerase [Sphingomonas humi]|uniref:Aldose 1-epimerase n=2 Tax=Sphingomonas humi TaxID=335630 RepID=A0ABP7RZJ8_9SPHN
MLLTLEAGSLALRIAPATGGAIHDLTFVGDGSRIPLLRAPREGADHVLDMASFPLVPFVNRIRGGRFTFRGREVVIRPNMANDISPLHGQGWLGSWTVERSSAREAELRFVHEAGEWPWAYEVRQLFSLEEEGLTLRLECRNRDVTPMPCGLGQHPYFPCTGETRIRTSVRTAFEIDEHVLPVGEVPAVGRYDLGDRAVCGQGLDHGFGGWGGEAVLSDPAWPGPLRLSSEEARFFQLYSPESGGIFVAEPVTHANAALNEPEERWGDLGLKVLEPGEAMALTMRLAIDGTAA